MLFTPHWYRVARKLSRTLSAFFLSICHVKFVINVITIIQDATLNYFDLDLSLKYSKFWHFLVIKCCKNSFICDNVIFRVNMQILVPHNFKILMKIYKAWYTYLYIQMCTQSRNVKHSSCNEILWNQKFCTQEIHDTKWKCFTENQTKGLLPSPSLPKFDSMLHCTSAKYLTLTDQLFIDIFIVTGEVLHMNYGVFFDKQLRSWNFGKIFWHFLLLS